MAVKVIMPILGLTMTEGKIARWLKNEGDYIKKGEPLLEIATDKIVTEVESPGEGILVKIIRPKDSVIPVTEMIGVIANEGENIDDLLQESPGDESKGSPEAPVEKEERREIISSPPAGGRVKISPLARRVAAEHNLETHEIRNIKGTGFEGRIKKDNVLEYIKGKEVKPMKTREPRVMALTDLRRTIASRLTKSWETPHFYLESEIDAGRLIEMRDGINQVLQKENLKVTITDLLTKIIGHVLAWHRYMNVRFSDGGIQQIEEINVGIAVGISEGLIVPVVKDADQKGIRQIASESRELISKAKAAKLTMEDISGGTFTLSNLGMFPVDAFTAIINPPEAAILSVGRIVDKPMVIQKEICIRPCMRITLGLDHRAVDGAQAAGFISALKDAIENPYLLSL